MTFPTIPTSAAGRILSTLNTVGGATKTFPNLGSLTKDSGDLLIAICVEFQSNSSNAEFSAWGGGFTEFSDQATTGGTMGIGAAHKWSTGSETGTFTVTTVDTSAYDSVMILMSIPGAHASTAPVGGAITNSVATASDPGLVGPPSWGTEDTLWIAVCGLGEIATSGSFTAPTAPPTNYTNMFVSSLTADVIGGVYAAVAFRQFASSTDDIGPFTLDTSSTRNSSVLYLVRPAAVGPVNYNETGRAVTIAATVTAPDQADLEDPLALTVTATVTNTDSIRRFDTGLTTEIAATVTTADQADLEDPLALTAAATVTISDQADLEELLEVSVTATVTSTDTHTGVPVNYDETARLTEATATVTSTDQVDLEEPLAITTTATVTTTDQVDYEDPLTVIATATVTTSDQADLEDPLEISATATVTSTEQLDLAEPATVDAAATVTTTDQADYEDPLNLSLTAFLTSTDLLSAPGYHDETQRTVDIVADVTSTDTHIVHVILNYDETGREVTVTATIESIDTADIEDLVALAAAATVTVTDQADFGEHSLVSAVSSINRGASPVTAFYLGTIPIGIPG